MDPEPAGNTPSGVSPDLSIAIVHGTWGRGVFPKLRARLPFQGPLWFERKSQFCMKLAEQLSRRNISARIWAFEWSGANSVIARDRAGAALAAHFRDEAAQSPSSAQVIIGHSHGGNVAIRTLQHLGTNHKSILLVTLATPFIEVMPYSKPSDVKGTFRQKLEQTIKKNFSFDGGGLSSIIQSL
jgi:hypothetical protein